MRLIDADKVHKAIKKIHRKSEFRRLSNERLVDLITSAIATIQTVDAVPVRHGRWKREVLGSTSGYGTTVMYWCSECERMSISKYNFCPNCGCKMDERKEE